MTHFEVGPFGYHNATEVYLEEGRIYPDRDKKRGDTAALLGRISKAIDGEEAPGETTKDDVTQIDAPRQRAGRYITISSIDTNVLGFDAEVVALSPRDEVPAQPLSQAAS